MNRDELMRKVQETRFALVDTGLFLDSHPNCEVALNYFKETQEMYEKYVELYETHFGPITFCKTDVTNGWAWTQDAWPWELEG